MAQRALQSYCRSSSRAFTPARCWFCRPNGHGKWQRVYASYGEPRVEFFGLILTPSRLFRYYSCCCTMFGLAVRSEILCQFYTLTSHHAGLWQEMSSRHTKEWVTATGDPAVCYAMMSEKISEVLECGTCEHALHVNCVFFSVRVWFWNLFSAQGQAEVGGGTIRSQGEVACW